MSFSATSRITEALEKSNFYPASVHKLTPFLDPATSISHDIEQRICSLEKTIRVSATSTYIHNINIRDIDQRLRSLEKTTDSGANRTHKHIRNVNDTLHTTIRRNINALNLRIDALHSLRINDQQRINLLEKSLRHPCHKNAAMNDIIDNLHMDNAKYASKAIVSDPTRFHPASLLPASTLTITTTTYNESNLTSVPTPTISPRAASLNPAMPASTQYRDKNLKKIFSSFTTVSIDKWT
ncbi:hypothetical protein BDK51DRAFT_38925 [Blyttiomyces helicus]|uniref:Uncharacterized protein n=1 Tax=Blyttiomyces helicus TaxID=388810 RepID=A0A4V1IS07_9FUNG|nr:hypothetical protein BDK51DRAFT_38925 [Blyttiomyces helicus]|eukprot:RKO91897.1 hypothetical protein BDK51DRAFT_38925 [Blyttiomyces helicus]